MLHVRSLHVLVAGALMVLVVLGCRQGRVLKQGAVKVVRCACHPVLQGCRTADICTHPAVPLPPGEGLSLRADERARAPGWRDWSGKDSSRQLPRCCHRLRETAAL